MQYSPVYKRPQTERRQAHRPPRHKAQVVPAPHGLISDDRNPQTARVRCEAFVHRSSGREATSGYWLVIEELGSCRPSLNLRRPRTRRHSRGIALFCRPFVRVQRYGPLRRLHYHNLLLLLVFHLLAPRASVLSPCLPLYTW